MLAHLDAVATMVVAVVLGVAAHELSHVLVLRLSGVGSTIEVLPAADDRGLVAGMGGRLARVRVQRPGDIAPGALRVAALMPLLLVVPLVVLVAGPLPNPFVSGSVGAKLVVIAWLACCIPSPQDFSLAWYPERALAAARETAPSATADPAA